jgi:uncharacterized protein YbjT (DUF2867 family)
VTAIAVIGATGTAGSRVTSRLKGLDVTVVEIDRTHGVDLISGNGLSEALRGVDVVIDTSNVLPPDDTLDITEAQTTATHNVVGACAAAEDRRLVLLSIAGIDGPEFDDCPYYSAKRLQAQIALHSGLPTTIVRSTHWYEFAGNPLAVTFTANEVVAQDWLIQPIAADTVAEVLVVAAVGRKSAPRTITGPDVMRLPELTSKMLDAQGDQRRVRTEDPPLAALGDGALLAPNHAAVIGPDVETWIQSVSASAAPSRGPAESLDSAARKDSV